MQILKKDNLYDDELFTSLNDINEKIINWFLKSKKDNELLKDLCKKYRNILRKISQESKVDIEPEILTPLLNKLISNENIIYSICPGAGGYDSIILMSNDNINKEELIKESVIDEISNKMDAPSTPSNEKSNKYNRNKRVNEFNIEPIKKIYDENNKVNNIFDENKREILFSNTTEQREKVLNTIMYDDL